MMTRRRTPISIYDYPEHLNPFRDDVDEGEDIKYHTTGRRRSSFRVNAWSVFAGRGKSPDRSTPSPVASRFLTWTPKVLRRASFRRMISPTTQAPPEHKNALSPPPRTLPARPPIPTHINNNCTPSSAPAPVPAVRTRRLAQRAGGEDETKYIQQGAKPKKKRRAPAPPTPQPGRASQPQEPGTSSSAAQQQLQSSGEQKNVITATSAECYAEQSRISPAESEKASVAASEATAEVTQSNNSSAASEELPEEGQGEDVTSREAPGQLVNKSAPETADMVSQDLTVEQNTSQALSVGSSAPTERSLETITGKNEVTIAEQSAGDIDQRSTSESINQETKTVHQDRSDTAETNVNEILSANEGELPLQGSTDMENTRELEEYVSVTETSVIMENRSEMEDTKELEEHISVSSAEETSVIMENRPEMETTKELEEYISVSSTEQTSVIMENGSEGSPLKIEESKSSNSLNDIQREHVHTEEEESDGNKSLSNAPLENGLCGSDSEISPSKTDLIDEESKPLPKPRTILPEKPTEQDKKP